MSRCGARHFRLFAPDFSLDHTLNSAQMFRYRPEDGGYIVHTGAHRFWLCQRADALEARVWGDLSERDLAHYLALDENYAAMCERLSAHRELRPALRRCRGLRILRQDPWECLVGFICSSCCNVPRIRRVVEALCEASGERVHGWRAFPRPGALPDEPGLRSLGAGFRGRFLAAANRPDMAAWLEALRPMPFPAARARLMELQGVGEKVADCVLLYSLGFSQAFPIDVWVRRAMEHLYFNGSPVPAREMQSLAAERFGGDAGYAQQFLFHFWRTRRP